MKKIISKITIGVVISLISTIIMLLIYAIVLINTDIQETTIKTVIIVISVISLLIGSTISNFKNRKNGLVSGGMIGIMYMSIIYIISGILNYNFSFNVQIFFRILVCAAIGILGGIIGINMKK